jgi:hypothetical protein
VSAPAVRRAIGACAVVGGDNVHRNPSLVVGFRGVFFYSRKGPGLLLQHRYGAGEDACEVHNLSHDFKDGVRGALAL